MSGSAKGEAASLVPGERFKVAGWVVDARALTITKDGETRHVEAKVMDLLVCLAARAGEVMTRDELEKKLWPGGLVSYHSLTTAIIKLRKAFGDTARDPGIIETVPKVGYRLIAEVKPALQGDREAGDPAAGDGGTVETTTADIPARTGETEGSRWPLPTTVALVALLLIVGALLWWQPWAPGVEPARTEEMAHPLPDKPSIAVLPFKNVSADPRQEYFVDGITEDLITDLSKMAGLFVVARNSVFTYKNRTVKVREVAEDLGVRYVLEGSVRREGEQVRINAQLIDALSGGHVWAERYDGVLDDVFALQDQVTGSIAAQLAVNLREETAERSPHAQSIDIRAYDLFLQGWQHYRKGTAAAYEEASGFFEQAIDADRDYGRAHAALAAVYWKSFWKGWWLGEQRSADSLGLAYYQTSERLRIALRRALQQPTALTHQIAAERSAYYPRTTAKKALAEAELALALDPNDPAGHLAKASALLKDDRPRQAETSVRAAMRLDPHYPPDYLVRLALAQLQLGDYQAAAESLEQVMAQTPDDDWALVYLAAAYGQIGLEQEAADVLKRANALRAEAGWGPVTVLAAGHPFFRWLGNSDALQEGLRKAGARPGGEWLSLIDYSVTPPEIKGVRTIDADTAHALHERGAVFVDVQTSWFGRRIPGAYFLEMWSGEGWLFNEVALRRLADPDDEVVIYSNYKPNWAGHASALAASRGFNKIHYFPGGVDEWEASGYPVETGSVW